MTPPSDAAAAASDPIRHVVVLMMENRSFDHMLGYLQQGVYPDIDGIPSAGARSNRDNAGNAYAQLPGTLRQIAKDPNHECSSVIAQIAGGAMTGFVTNYQGFFPSATPAELGEVMKYHDRGTLPALHTLAETFTVCDRWFSSLPGPTWPNRLFLHSGTSLGKVTMPDSVFNLNWHWYDQATLYDRLNAQKTSWRIYYGDVPQSLVLVHQFEPENAVNYRKFQHFFADAAGDEEEFPQFSFIEPAYNPPGANDDHPPYDVMSGETLIAEVYNALRANDALWKSTLLLIVYDEHGGFYDHVAPPATVPPDNCHSEFSFDRLGARVPAILVSPYVARGVFKAETEEKKVFDHTSLLRYVSDKWRLGPLGARTAQANSFAAAIGKTARTDTPETISAMPAGGLPPQPPVAVPTTLSDQQQALLGLSHLLETMTASTDADTTAARNRHVLSGPQSQIDVAMDRVEDFLAEARTKFPPI
ncbi:MAG TPA: alkaline phosphatase family protein [Stellaceae bacterium]|nr:alkaline phosphatase family protein [Stellaceae bacterium]